jgi:predicted Co/Zn/Cd cation transporter (cation efflux family)
LFTLLAFFFSYITGSGSIFFEGLAIRDYEYRLMKSGRSTFMLVPSCWYLHAGTFMLVHFMVSDDFRVSRIEELDAIRDGIEEKILRFDGNIIIEILFIKDREWSKLR